MWTFTDRKFSLQNSNEVYFGDVFIGYQQGKNSTIIIDMLNHDISILKDFDWGIDEKGLYTTRTDKSKKIIVEIKNSNFNQLILDKLNWVCPFKEEHTHYAIKTGDIYTNFLSASYKEAIEELIKLKQQSKKFPEFDIQWEIIPLLLS